MASTGKSWLDQDSDSDGEDIPKGGARNDTARAPPVTKREELPQPQDNRKPPPTAQGHDGHRDREPRKQNVPNPNGPFIVFVGNLTFEVTTNDLGNFFHNGGCDVSDVKIQTDRETGRSKGFAHVEFKNLASLQKALTANGVDFQGRPLNVDVGRPPIRRDDKKDNRFRDKDRNGGDRDHNSRRGRDVPSDNAPIERGVKVQGAARTRASDKSKTARHEADSAPAPPVVPERKPLELKSRTIPIGVTDTSKPTSYSSIFGDAKPRDEKVMEKKTPMAAPAVAEIEKKLEEVTVTPPAPPVSDKVAAVSDDKKVVEKSGKDRRATKPTWSEARNREEGGVRREGAGRGDLSGRGRSGRGENTAGRGGKGGKDQKSASATNNNKAAKPDRRHAAEATEEKGPSSAQPVDTLAGHVDASKIENPKAVAAKPRQTNIFAAIGGDSDSDED